MGGVARQHDPADTKAFDRPLMQPVRPHHFELVGLVAGQEKFVVLRDALDHFLFGQARILAVGAAPEIGLVDLGKNRPVHRIEDKRRPGEAVLLEIVPEIGGDEPVGPRKALEGQIKRGPHAAAPPVRADQPFTAVLLCPLGGLHGRGDAVVILLDGHHARVPARDIALKTLEMGQGHPREKVLPQMDVIGIRRMAFERRKIKVEDLAIVQHPVLIILLDETGALQIFENAEPIHAFQHGPVIDDRARGHDDIGLGFENAHRDTRTCEAQSRNDADRPRPDDQDSVYFLHNTLPPPSSYKSPLSCFDAGRRCLPCRETISAGVLSWQARPPSHSSGRR